ncbi:hypothetical protein [Methanofollis ethanolicus]|uniref:hypothetical protein n=1 Tax=Methanofollis ethanolicus TaxID=488124 RepID=UPI0008304F1E|nr:hypothetical protein [Methanofollis ethanolicus]
MDPKAAIIPITFIKDIFNAEDAAVLPVVDIIAFEAYGSSINLGRGYLGGRYSTEKVCIKSEFQGKVWYSRLEWIWAGGLYGSMFAGPSGTWVGEGLMLDGVDVRHPLFSDTSGDVEIRNLFDDVRSKRHCCVLNAGKGSDGATLRFTYGEQQGPVLQTTIRCGTGELSMIKVDDRRLTVMPPAAPR